ncbi:MAG: pentapeptide repeat-containing protein [candidate division Zixibacteria bacterium]|nr:pentapeptide repeat-containing protein [candidate division Zixibacteria bacterium]
MAEDKEGPKQKAEDTAAAAGKVESNLRVINDDELHKMLHVTRLRSVDEAMQRLNLSNANLGGRRLAKEDLRGAILTGSNLEGAILYLANLEGASLAKAKLMRANMRAASLVGADLNGADLDNAILEKADLRSATLNNVLNLHTANLRDCNFEGATGLTGAEFARADITGARLPEGIRDFKMLTIVEETSRNAIKIFIATLLACVYSWLTIGSTTDVALLTNSSATPLPIIQTAIPIATFYLVAPVLLLALYFYLHFYLQHLWTALGTLPAIFEDGRPLDQRAYPWPLNGLVRRHFEKLRGTRPLMIRLEEYTVIALAWWLVPFTLFCFWLRYIPKHFWRGTISHIFLIVVSIGAGVYFYHLHAQTLRGDKPKPVRIRTAWRERRVYPVFLVAIILVLVSFNSIHVSSRNQFVLLRTLGFNVFADFREKDISTRPDNYWLLTRGSRDSSVTGARLAGADIRCADATRAFLFNADLRRSNLRGAILDFAQLQRAKLDSAILDSASLRNASLQGASLFRAKVQGADLAGANLDSAILERALLPGASFVDVFLQFDEIRELYKKLSKGNYGLQIVHFMSDSRVATLRSANLLLANLDSATLIGTWLQGANLSRAKLRVANLRYANLDSATLIGTWLQGANLSGAKLRGADLQNANLDSAILDSAWLLGADLTGATLRGADLKGAHLDSTNLSGADLTNATGLIQKQLDAACGDSLTKLPTGLHIKPCPKKPK